MTRDSQPGTENARERSQSNPPPEDTSRRFTSDGQGWRRRWWRRLLAAMIFLARLAALVWASLAIYYSDLDFPWLRLVVAAVFVMFGVWALWLSTRRGTSLLFGAVFIAVLLWEISIPPSHNRTWRREVAVMPRAIINGDRVRLTGVRSFDYRSVEDFDVRYLEREVHLSHLTSVDFFVSYWSVELVAHTFVSFNFDNAPPVCISIEVRPEVDESFSPLASLFKQYELIYVVGEEDDLVRVRTNYRLEEVYLYRIKTTPEAARRLFKVYLGRINSLAERPEWYHLLRNSCTINIVRYAQAAGRDGGWDFRHYLNGWSDRFLYAVGLVETSLPFAELRRRSRINEAARLADDADFSRSIRASLPNALRTSP